MEVDEEGSANTRISKPTVIYRVQPAMIKRISLSDPENNTATRHDAVNSKTPREALRHFSSKAIKESRYPKLALLNVHS